MISQLFSDRRMLAGPLFESNFPEGWPLNKTDEPSKQDLSSQLQVRVCDYISRAEASKSLRRMIKSRISK